MVATPRLTTADDLLNWPDDGFRDELVRGELRKMSSAGQFHGEFAAYLTISLGSYALENGLGKVYTAEAGFRLASNPDHVRVPDVAFVSSARLEEFGESEGFFPAAPDIAIEVMSPSDRYAAVNEKVRDWLDAGTQAVIVVVPRRRVLRIHRSPADAVELNESETIEIDDVVPGWHMPVRDVFGR